MLHLTKRLAAAAALVPPGTNIADIGTDHAYLPAALVRSGTCPAAIAADVARGPLAAARAHIEGLGLMARIDCRMSDGLTSIRPHEVDGAVFCGMGGPLIMRLLDQSPAVVATLSFLVLQPQSEAAVVRRYLYEHDWHIDAEQLVLEDGRLYELLRAVPGKEAMPSGRELDLGPCNWAGKVPLVPQLIAKLREKDERVLAGLRRSQSDQSRHIDIITHHIGELEEALCLYNSAKSQR